MKTAFANIIAVIPSLVAQLFAIGGVLALVGAILFALTFVCQRRQARVATREASVTWLEPLPLGVAQAT